MYEEPPDTRRSEDFPEDTRPVTIEMYEDVITFPVSEEETQEPEPIRE